MFVGLVGVLFGLETIVNRLLTRTGSPGEETPDPAWPSWAIETEEDDEADSEEG